MAHGIDTQELLDQLAGGHKLKPEDIDLLLQRKVPEDLFLEYKSGKELEQEKKATQTIRQYLSGFANSMGGVLIVGIKESEPDWTVESPKSIEGSLEEWASRALTEIAHYFSFPPQFQVVNHPQGDLLVAYVLRSSNLVPCLEKRQFVYYLRLHDQTLNNKTLQIPEYLIGDLMLGRRNHPYLNIKNAYFDLSPGNVTHIEESTPVECLVINFGMYLTIENESLMWADSVQIGAIRYIQASEQNLSNHLLSNLHIQELSKDFWGHNDYNLYYSSIPARPVNLNPFSVETINIPGNTILVRTHGFGNHFYRYTWKAGLCLMVKNSPPLWYQIELEVNKKLLKATNENSAINLKESSDLLKISRATGYRPTIAWEGIGELDWE